MPWTCENPFIWGGNARFLIFLWPPFLPPLNSLQEPPLSKDERYVGEPLDVSVVLFFPLLGFSFSGCVETESGKLQFSSQDEKYVGRICWSRGGANLRIPFLWGTSAGESNVGLQWEKRLQRAENWKRGPHLRSLMTMSEQWKEKGEIMIVMVKFGAVDGVLVAHICSILSNCFSRYESHPF